MVFHPPPKCQTLSQIEGEFFMMFLKVFPRWMIENGKFDFFRSLCRETNNLECVWSFEAGNDSDVKSTSGPRNSNGTWFFFKSRNAKSHQKHDGKWKMHWVGENANPGNLKLFSTWSAAVQPLSLTEWKTPQPTKDGSLISEKSGQYKFFQIQYSAKDGPIQSEAVHRAIFLCELSNFNLSVQRHRRKSKSLKV